MKPTRRTLIAASLLAFPVLHAVRAEADDARTADRTIGNVDAKVTVQEYFSLTCTHCAAFQKETFPRVKAELIDTGKVRYIWRDYPLDQLALYAAMVARALPQDRWAFTRSANPVEELAKLALLAGLSRTTFDTTVRDDKLKQFVLDEQAGGEKKYSVNSTPTFVFNDKPTPGAVSYDTFLKAVEAASA